MNAASGVPKQKQKQDGKRSRSGAELGRGVDRRRRLHGQLSGEHHLVHPARADSLDGARDDLLVALRRIAARDRSRCAGMRVLRRQRRGAQRGEAPGDSPRCSSRGTRVRRPAPRRRSGSSGPRSGRSLPLAGWRAPAAGRTRSERRRRPERMRVPWTRPGRPRRAARPARRRRGRAATLEQPAARSENRSGPLLTTSAASRARRAAKPRSGCSQQNQRSVASREPAAIAVGSTLSSSSIVARDQATLTGSRERALELREERPGVEGDAHPRQTGCAFAHPRISCRAWTGRSRPRPCGPSRSGRAGGSSARRPRSCRRCR